MQEARSALPRERLKAVREALERQSYLASEQLLDSRETIRDSFDILCGAYTCARTH
jgi:hypothetical protein